MFEGKILGVTYHTWESYKKAWNEAVRAGKLFNDKGLKIKKLYPEK